MKRSEFWTEVFAFQGSVTPYVKGRVLVFGVFALLVALAMRWWGGETGVGVAPYEIIGVVLALLLVVRTNSGYDRWYEGRKLWGGIVNQSRNLTLLGLAHGPRDRAWRSEFVRWTIAFSHACRHSLRGERDLRDMRVLLGEQGTAELQAAEHMPMFVAQKLANMLRRAVDDDDFDHFAFLQAEHERTELIDHIGSCERIAKTPLALVFSIKIRRFLFLYLTALPFGVVDKTGLFAPIITMLVAYPLLALDQIGMELQNPFCTNRLSHLPLQDICTTIERNLLAALSDDHDQAASSVERMPPAMNGHELMEVPAVPNRSNSLSSI